MFFACFFVLFFMGMLSGLILYFIFQNYIWKKYEVIDTLTTNGQVEIFSLEQMLNEPRVDSWEDFKYKRLVTDIFHDAILIDISGEQKMHKHNGESHFIYILSGLGEVVSDKKALKVKVGSLIYVPSGVPHSIKAENGTTMTMLQFSSPPSRLTRFQWSN